MFWEVVAMVVVVLVAGLMLAAVFGGHGEGQRIVIAPVSVEDCYHTTILAFNSSERYQCPVLLLSDSTQGMTKAVLPVERLKSPRIVSRTLQSAKAGKHGKKSPGFLRYRLSENGINPMTIPGTAAATMDGQLDKTVVQERFERLIELQNRISLESNQALVGRTLEVLVDGPSKKDLTVMTTRSRGNQTVHATRCGR